MEIFNFFPVFYTYEEGCSQHSYTCIRLYHKLKPKTWGFWIVDI